MQKDFIRLGSDGKAVESEDRVFAEQLELLEKSFKVIIEKFESKAK